MENNNLHVMSVDEALLMVQYIRKKGGKNAEVPDEIISTLLERMKTHETWYVYYSKFAEIPYLIDDKAYIFTSLELAEKTANKLALNLEEIAVHGHEFYNEPIFELFYRHGIDYLSLNKGQGGVVLETDMLVSDEFKDKYPENIRKFNRSVDDFVLNYDMENPETIYKYESIFVREMCANELYYPSDDNGIPIIEKAVIEDKEEKFMLIFTDIAEARKHYPRKNTVISKLPSAELFEKISKPIFILNSMGANIELGASNIQSCLDYKSIYDKVFDEVKNEYESKEDREYITELIAKYPDICAEFLNGFIYDGTFDYHPNNPVIVHGYSAESIQKIKYDNPVDTYKLLALLRDDAANLKIFFKNS